MNKTLSAGIEKDNIFRKIGRPINARHMNFVCTKLFEIPIYRCSPEEYRKEEAIRKERAFLIHKRFYPESDFNYVSWRGYRYNEIIGWVVIFAYERRVRAEYWFVRQKVRRGLIRKQFENKGKLFQIRIRDNVETSKEIFDKLKTTVLTVSKEWPLSKYYLDFECFDNISSKLNWRNLLPESCMKIDKSPHPPFTKGG